MGDHPLLSVRNLVKRFGGVTATDDANLDVMPGEIHALIGPNGAGKTTFVAQVSGLLRPDAGVILFDGKDVTTQSAPARCALGLARSFQVTSIFREFTVIENVLIGIQARAGHCFRFWDSPRKDPSLCEPAIRVLGQVGLGDRTDTLARNLSHGEQRLLEIALALATQPRLLLLDEPTAGMGTEESDNITRLLAELRGQYSILLIEHDMDAVFRLSDRITVMVYGRPIASGTPDEIRRNVEVRHAYLGDAEEI